MKTLTTQDQVDAIGLQSAKNGADRELTSFSRSAIASAFLSLTLLLSVGSASAQQASASQSAQAAGQKMTTAEIPALFSNSIDSKKLKEGQEVDVKTAAPLHLQDGTLISRGTKVVGHVTQSKARSNGDAESSLSIVFDKINLSGGKEVTMTAVIQAVAPPLNTGNSAFAGVDYSSIDQALQKPANPNMAKTSVPVLNPESEGVLGIKNLQLGSDGVLNSDQKSVKLDSGTQVMIQAKIAG